MFDWKIRRTHFRSPRSREQRFFVLCSLVNLGQSLVELCSLGYLSCDWRAMSLFDDKTKLGQWFRKQEDRS